MKIELPNNNFGAIIMLILILLTFLVPFTLVLWLVGLFAPLYVTLPLAFLAGMLSFITSVKWKPHVKS